MQNTPKIILGIDPGTLVMGFGVLSVQGQALKLICMDVLKIPTRYDTYERLEIIYRKVTELIHQYKPDEFAIEAPFFGKNVQSMLKLGRAQGVAIAAAMQHTLPISEYSPKKVKQSITGNGNAGKEQVLKMVEKLLQVQCTPRQFDASDAIAVAICHSFQGKMPVMKGAKKSADWKQFISGNPHRLSRPVK
ncbi:MAG TPA: crossover junction endodeoxyribonuclease RuvC [Ferruginibacter sp.]|nr:crossover junction endodeoxyribonuclease RuvC [Ferruginibacter sp.]HRO17346.1 crossover junction endodeoxyribonuclease RuvC [Ferruginibacter sp.]HRQ21737.1 crossover junction endodeoxyribonuclease RuvC [Ferruginibacter sp.]